MILGFTGTREGITNQTVSQILTVMDVLRCQGLKEIHHGQCVGADEFIHLLACQLAIPVVVHPPKNKKLVFDLNHKKFTKNKVTVLKDHDYLTRNRHIVKASDLVLAVPKTLEQKGGTWYTIDFAENSGKNVIVLPDMTGKIYI